jgi:hypothetical protein
MLIPKNLLDKLKIASSRDPSGVVAINRECYQRAVPSISTTLSSTMVDPTLPVVILAVDVPTWKLMSRDPSGVVAINRECYGKQAH